MENYFYVYTTSTSMGFFQKDEQSNLTHYNPDATFVAVITSIKVSLSGWYSIEDGLRIIAASVYQGVLKLEDITFTNPINYKGSKIKINDYIQSYIMIKNHPNLFKNI